MYSNGGLMDENVSCFKKHSIILKILLIMLACYIFNTKTIYAQVPHPRTDNDPWDYKEILIIVSENESDYWANEILSNITEKLNSNNPYIRYRREYLESSSFTSNFWEEQSELMNSKYSNADLDLVIAIDDEALKFVNTYYSKEFLKDTPVVFGGINDVSILSEYPASTFTGVTKYKNVRDLINQILELEPDTKGFNILLDDTITSGWIETQVKDCMPYLDSSLEFNFVKSNFLGDICYQLENSVPDFPMIIVGNFSDGSSTPLKHDTIVKWLDKYTDNTMYTLNEAYIKSGIIGGSITTAKNHSDLIYDIVSRVLNGEKADSIPSIYDNSDTLVFDAREVDKYNLPRKNISKNAVIINDSLMYKGVSYRIFIGVLIIAIILSVFLILEFYLNKSNAIKAEIVSKKYTDAIEYDKIKTECFANSSHEIRTLLNVILASIQLIDHHYKTGNLVFKNSADISTLTYMKKNGARLMALINNLMDVSKIDSGYLTLNTQTINIVEFLEDITLSCVEYANSRKISLIFDTNEEELYMNIDSEKLERIHLNLLSNAIKYTEPGGTINVTINCLSDSIKVSVKDSGIGIPKEMQASIFERFAQVKDENKIYSSGTGIGLSLVSSLLNLIDGDITLNSEPGNGSEFIYTLPIKESDYEKDITTTA